ncbi:TrbI/VirB10 family protein [Trichormus sp. NMC-1]|uniref:TrbI/VirB10 family protein n=1 Tax=Trichormus sp. NMC-1 TaxID=1853259 RepID=UPI0008DC0BF6|nr:TrbI/VirB10 family protein [Trichormus sp. NMC-1]
MQTNLENRTESNKIDDLLNFAEDNSENNLAGTENQNIITESDVELADELELVETQHSLVNSPWSRTIVVGGGFGVGFMLIFMLLNPMMNGKVTKKEQTPEVAATSPPEKEVTKNDGDIYAKLALQKQAEELEAFKEQNRIRQESLVEKQDKQTVENLPRTKTIPNKSVNRETSSTVAREQQPRRPMRREKPVQEAPITRSSPPVQTVATSTILPKQQTTFKTSTEPADPLAELARLRSLGSGGQIDYAAAITNDNQEVASTQTQNVVTSDYVPRRRSSYNRDSQLETELETVTTDHSESDYDSNFDNNKKVIEQLKAKWTPVISAKSLDKSDKVTNFSDSKNYSPEEAAIIEGREEQYLRVGEYTTGILETPVVWSANVNSNNSHLQTKFVVKLTQPLLSNIGEEAIPANTLLSAEIQEVDSSGRVTAVVTAILKDGTEYTLRPGTIVIQGQGGEPLIANQYRDKGKEILSLDAGLGLMSGLAKVGEVVNQPDIQSSISQSNGGFSSIQTSRNGNRSLLGAFAQGAFGTVSKQVEERNQKAIAEIIKRPNIWFIPPNTKINVQVNRSLRL